MFVEYRSSILNHPPAREALASICRDAHVLELGPGKWGGLAHDVMRADANSYTGIDRDHVEMVLPYEKVRYHAIDALTYLENLPESSVKSVSTGFLDARIHAEETFPKIIAQIARVAPDGMHWIAPDDTLAHDLFGRAGIALREVAPFVYRTQRI